ncbi:MAG: hypothetical protein JOZ77_10150 [Candidatus Eremiobacteraeota bacterium]|nr:hypothetical protein [Candidatus Eremiobacteraeota bacterium]
MKFFNVKFSNPFVALVGIAIATAISGCVAAAPSSQSFSPPAEPTATPAANTLYVDHAGTLFVYRLPLSSASKPVRTLTEWPGLGLPPVIAADQFGNVAVASTTAIRFFSAPIVSLAPARAKLTLKLTPAITEVGDSGADLVDMEYDPNENLWLLNNLGALITELRSPISKSSTAAVSIGFGAPGSKTAGFTTLVQARFDVNAALYVYASSSLRSRIFKISFPYARPPSDMGLDLAQADFIDSSQWPPTAPNAPTLLLGQYFGPLRSPTPGSPPSPPVDAAAQFAQPFNPSQGRFPSEHISTILGALIADPYRASFYALDASSGSLEVFGLPMQGGEKPKITLPCLGTAGICDEKGEHVFLAP